MLTPVAYTLPEQVPEALNLIDDFIAEVKRVRTSLELLEAWSPDDDYGDVWETSSSTVRHVGWRPANSSHRIDQGRSPSYGSCVLDSGRASVCNLARS